MLVAIVGMAGAGKSEVAKMFAQQGFSIIRFGDLTDQIIREQGLPLNEANESSVREMLRHKHGMAAYALLNLPRIEEALGRSDVVIDGLYSWEEYLFLKEKYAGELVMVAVWASPQTRYKRLAQRSRRPLSLEEAMSRDRFEIEKANKGGPIAMADFTLLNESTLEDLKAAAQHIILEMRSATRS